MFAYSDGVMDHTLDNARRPLRCNYCPIVCPIAPSPCSVIQFLDIREADGKNFTIVAVYRVLIIVLIGMHI